MSSIESRSACQDVHGLHAIIHERPSTRSVHEDIDAESHPPWYPDSPMLRPWCFLSVPRLAASTLQTPLRSMAHH